MMASDQELLERLAAGDSDEPLDELIRRHGRMVERTAARLVKDQHHAQDISQAVFLVLIKKAGSLSTDGSIGGWLYRATVLSARNWLKIEARRRRRESEAGESMRANQRSTPELPEEFDAALERLPGIYRQAIVLRFLENRSSEDISHTLGINPGALEKRLTRALQRLRIALGGASLAALTTSLSAEAAGAVAPSALNAAAVKAALVSAPTYISALSSETLKSMWWIKMKTVSAVAFVVLAVAGGGTLAVRMNGAESKPPKAEAAKGDHFPAWRTNKPVGTFFEIPNTAGMRGATNVVGATINEWNGLAFGPHSVYSVLASGHGEWRNGAHMIDLSADAPSWVTLDEGSAQKDVVGNAAYYKDGRPVGRHTYATTQFIPAKFDRDGVDRVMVFACWSAYGLENVLGGYIGGPQVDGFKIKERAYDPAKTWKDVPIAFWRFAAVCTDPRSGEVYFGADYKLLKWTPKTDTWSTVMSENGLLAWDQFNASVVDVKRDRVACLHHGGPYDSAKGPRLQCVDIAKGTLSVIPVTGLPTFIIVNSPSLTYDLDNDRYVFACLVNGEPTQFFGIDPTSGAAKLIATAPLPAHSIENRAQYVQELGGIVWVPQFANNICFLPTR